MILALQGLLSGVNAMCANYLYQTDKHYDISYDTGDKAIQCGRHNDVFKFWLMWRAKVRAKSHLQPKASLCIKIRPASLCIKIEILKFPKSETWLGLVID